MFLTPVDSHAFAVPSFREKLEGSEIQTVTNEMKRI